MTPLAQGRAGTRNRSCHRHLQVSLPLGTIIRPGYRRQGPLMPGTGAPAGQENPLQERRPSA